MKHSILKTYIILFLFCSCNSKRQETLKTQWKEEIFKTEQEFADLLKEKGLHDAFVAYADLDAVIMRNNKLIVGRKNIKIHFRNANTTTLSWTPDFIEVSNSGDLGYTYGTYHYRYKDSLGNELVDTGIFHTIWKRQENGKWKFVWD